MVAAVCDAVRFVAGFDVAVVGDEDVVAGAGLGTPSTRSTIRVQSATASRLNKFSNAWRFVDARIQCLALARRQLRPRLRCRRPSTGRRASLRVPSRAESLVSALASSAWAGWPTT